jgi:class 3 adenylate cyclase
MRNGKSATPLVAIIFNTMIEHNQLSIEKMRVLVVDDSRTLRKVLVRELRQIGPMQIEEASDGVEALEILQARTFDLVLLDMEMPELDGLGVLTALKESGQLSGLPVIVISSAEEIDKTVKCIEMGAEDYLPKTFNPILLRARILSSFEKKRFRDLEKDYLEQLQKEKELLQMEQMKSERLILNILPKPIAERLKKNEKNISSSYEDVTILFSDIVGFTQMSSLLTPSDLVALLNDLFTRFDKRAESLGLEKIKTIGDAYMAAGGVPVPRADHADIVADMALGMLEDLAEFNRDNQISLQMRIGLNSGPVVAGIIGFTKFSYDLWGSTVNVASRMESSSVIGKIQISPSTAKALIGRFDLQGREVIEVKGIGKVLTHFLLKRAD